MSCGAWKFVDSMKLHGCLYEKCPGCGCDLCMHWPYCPRCTHLQIEELKGALGRANLNVSLLLGKLRDQLDVIVKDWGEAFAKHGFLLHRGLTPEQNAAEWRRESDRLYDECLKIAERFQSYSPHTPSDLDLGWKGAAGRIAEEIRALKKRKEST